MLGRTEIAGLALYDQRIRSCELETYFIKQDLSAVVTNRLENFLDLAQEANMENWNRKLDVTKVTWTFEHVFTTSTACCGTIDRSQLWIVQTLFTRFVPLLVHSLGVFNVAYTHVFNFLRREHTKLNLLNGLQRRAGIRERVNVRHFGGIVDEIVESWMHNFFLEVTLVGQVLAPAAFSVRTSFFSPVLSISVVL